MARTEKAAHPITGHTLVGTGLEFLGGRTAEVRANTDYDHNFRLDRTGIVLRVGWLLILFRLRICNGISQLGQRVHHFLGAIDDPHRLAAPLDSHHLTRFKLADIDFHRCACSLGTLGRKQAGDERHECSYSPRTAHGRGRDDQTPPPAVHFSLIAHNADP